MIKEFCSVHNFKFCDITLKSNGSAITGLFFGTTGDPTDTIPELHLNAVQQLDEYFNEKRKIFDVPLVFHGTPFQEAVWKALMQIPYGETRSYADIAAAIGNPKACRAVGNANHRNPISIIIPCHRVIASNGMPGGYGGGLDIKLKLLDLESKK